MRNLFFFSANHFIWCSEITAAILHSWKSIFISLFGDLKDKSQVFLWFVCRLTGKILNKGHIEKQMNLILNVLEEMKLCICINKFVREKVVFPCYSSTIFPSPPVSIIALNIYHIVYIILVFKQLINIQWHVIILYSFLFLSFVLFIQITSYIVDNSLQTKNKFDYSLRMGFPGSLE